jgi:hypothetical protein
MESLALFKPGRAYLAGTDAVLIDLKAFPQRFQNLQSYMLADSVGWLPAFVFSLRNSTLQIADQEQILPPL